LTTDNISVGGEVEDYLLRLYGGRPSVPTNDTYTVFEDNTLTTSDLTGTTTAGVPNDDSVLANDTDADGNGMQVILFDAPDYAQNFTLNPNGTFTYTPNANFNGTDTFTYKLCDVTPDCSTATVTVTVNPVNDLPVAVTESMPGKVIEHFNGRLLCRTIVTGVVVLWSRMIVGPGY